MKRIQPAEIYNFQKLRDELKNKGHIFSTNTDWVGDYRFFPSRKPCRLRWAPKRSNRDKEEHQIPIEELRQGQHVVCGPGELVPVDGTVMTGEALVNQSSITGESVPVHLQAGSEAISGTVVEEGKLVIRADKVGEDASWARMSKYIRQSLERESSGQRQSRK